MKPKKSKQKSRQKDLFRPELTKMIDPGHGLVKLARAVNWHRMDEVFGETFSPDQGRPGISTRFMVSLHYLKYTHNLSDEDVVSAWVENPYWHYLGGMKYFEHDPPIHPSSMTRWRKRVGEAGAEEQLKETIEAGLRLKAVKAYQLKRVNIDTTVQEKDIRFPTDARSYDRARQRLVKAAKTKLEKFVEDTKADTQAAVTEWKAKRDRQKLEKRAERTRKYAEACIAVALCAAEEAEVVVLEAVAARRDVDEI